MKIAFLGGGALRLLGVLDEILLRPQTFPSPELVLMDRELARATVMARLANHLPSARTNPPIASATTDVDEALAGADFVYCCIRVGGVTALERDQRMAASYGFHGHDDFGPSAVMLTARTVPVVLDIARRMETLCPKAWLLIYTNPITTLVDAVNRYAKVRVVGLCPGVYNFAWDMDHLFQIGAPCPDLVYRGGGLNHLSWVTAEATYKSEPIMDLLRRHWADLPNRPGAARCGWHRNAPLVELYGAMFLNNGHQHHFFHHDAMARDLQAHLAAIDQTLRSARQAEEFARAARLADQPGIEDFWRQPVFMPQARRPFGELGVEFMQALLEGTDREVVVTVPNRGHIRGLPAEVPVEAPVRIREDRLEGQDLDPVPESLKGLCAAIAFHQQLTVDAAVRADKRALLQALLAEPTVRGADRAIPMFEDLWSQAVANHEVIADKSLTKR